MCDDAFHCLDVWISKNGWEGYDPYDIKGEKLFLLLSKNKYTGYEAELFLNLFPLFSRQIFKIKKNINPKAMALFARGYLLAYKKLGNAGFLKKAKECLSWLECNPSIGYSRYCWGYPFDWQSRIFISKGTPSGVVTSIAAHAFMDAYELTKDEKYLSIVKSCCDFMVNDLNIDEVDQNKICFSYTPLDNFHVHNASLFSASVLARAYPFIRREKYRELATNAMNYTVSYQNKNGSWYYWAPPDKVIGKVDNYHTGFVLECLNICRRLLGQDFSYEKELEKGLSFYAKNLFLKNGMPKMAHDSIYPIDIHSCSQGIITFYELSDFNNEYLNLAKKIAVWTIRNMQDINGYFYYRLYKSGYISKIPFIRWGQAWMLRSLSYIEEKT